MFRLGGPANEGITSGLAPRQGYDIGGLTREQIQEIQNLSREMTAGDRKADTRDFMIDWGLGMVGTPPTGNVLSTAANVARAPYERFMSRKAGRGETEADMFATLFKGAVGDDKTYAHRDKAAMIRDNMQKQFDLQNQLAGLAPNDPDREKIKNDIRTLKKQIRSPEFAETIKMMFSDERERRQLNSLIVEQVKRENPGLDEDSTEFKTKIWQLKKKVFEDLEFGILPEFNATGGRVGYQAAGSVMGDAIQSTPAMPEGGWEKPSAEEAVTQQQIDAMNQADTMPEELGDISYEELRSRLPQEVSDEIVRLLANSAEALEDFATIQTEQDIANFNKKYGVNLVLPAEG